MANVDDVSAGSGCAILNVERRVGGYSKGRRIIGRKSGTLKIGGGTKEIQRGHGSKISAHSLSDGLLAIKQTRQS